jgi:hypothetical protein
MYFPESIQLCISCECQRIELVDEDPYLFTVPA